MSKRSHKTLSIKVKQQIINDVKNGERKKDIALKYEIAPSTVTSILKKSETYMGISSNSKIKRHKNCEFPELENSLKSWWLQCVQNQVPVGGAIMREKAKKIAELLGITNFKGSDEWFDKFKKRNNISFKKIFGESADVDESVCINWREKLKNLIEGYNARNIFNADETALFFKCLPDRAYSLKGEKCHGGKISKDRVTLLLATNMDGTEKLKPLMIGKYAKPRCFKNIKTFPLEYRSNSKAWITSLLFIEWLSALNKQMMRQNRKILIFIDNCPAHNTKEKFSNIDIKFLPTNTTSKLQPLDKGIIQNFKTFYRKEVVMNLIDIIETKTDFKISLFCAMNMIDKAWRNVNSTTIKNCFRACGFYESSNIVISSNELLSIPEWDQIQQNPNHYITLNEFIHIDDDVATTGILSDLDILTISQEVTEETDSEVPLVSAKSAEKKA